MRYLETPSVSGRGCTGVCVTWRAGRGGFAQDEGGPSRGGGLVVGRGGGREVGVRV